MQDLLGLKRDEAVIRLDALGKAWRSVETGGYKAGQDLTAYDDVRVIGVREEAEGVLLITARF